MHGLDTMRKLNKAAEKGENRKIMAGTKKVQGENKELKATIKRMLRAVNKKRIGG